jgi:hypothetical protein
MTPQTQSEALIEMLGMSEDEARAFLEDAGMDPDERLREIREPDFIPCMGCGGDERACEGRCQR